jgi:protein NirF
VTKRYPAGQQPYDGLVTPDGRHYLAGLFGEDGIALLDLWQPEKGARKILEKYGRGEEKLPVFKMPHLRGWSVAAGRAWLPAIGRHEVLVADAATWQETGRVAVKGQPVFVMASPDGRQIWVNFRLPRQRLGAGDRHPERQGGADPAARQGRAAHGIHAARRGGVDLRARRQPRRDLRHADFPQLGSLPAEAPSGIFFSSRAARIGF